jgi:hypothetical protein
VAVFLCFLHIPFPDQNFQMLFLISIYKTSVNNRVYSIPILHGPVTSTVSIATTLCPGWLRNSWSIPSRNKKYMSSQKYTDQFCGPPILQYNGYQGLFCLGLMKLCIHLHLVSRLGMNGAIILTLHARGPTPLWPFVTMIHLLHKYYAGQWAG